MHPSELSDLALVNDNMCVKLDGNLGKGAYLLMLFPYYNTPNPHYHILLFSIVTHKNPIGT
jgi:hypothetical protein